MKCADTAVFMKDGMTDFVGTDDSLYHKREIAIDRNRLYAFVLGKRKSEDHGEDATG